MQGRRSEASRGIERCPNVVENTVSMPYQNIGIKRKFFPPEDQIILDQVAISGDSDDTWSILKHKLNRDSKKTIRDRYLVIAQSGCYKSGTWTLEEDTTLLESLFNDKIRNIDTIKSVSYLSMGNIDELKRSQHAIYTRYEGILKPLLLS